MSRAPDIHPNARLETFCDGVFAIALTLLVIDLRIPVTTAIHTSADLWGALGHLLPSVYAFALSFGITRGDPGALPHAQGLPASEVTTRFA